MNGVAYDRLLREFNVAQFLGAYSFWKVMEQSGLELSEEARQAGFAIVRALGRAALAAVDGEPRSQAEREAFEYCGVGKDARSDQG